MSKRPGLGVSGASMHRMVKRGAAALMLACMASDALAATAAASGCVRAEDMTALKAAAVQQKLMAPYFF